MKLLLIYEFIRKNFFNQSALWTLIFVNLSVSIHAAVSDAFFSLPSIQTILFHPQDDEFGQPIVNLHSGTPMLLSFDELDADTRSLCYSFAHCDAAWNKSDLMEIDYVDGFNKIYDAEKAEFSFNTKVDYVHYDLTIDTSILKLSGNYILFVADAVTNDLLLTQPLLVCENSVSAATRIVRGKSNEGGMQTLSFSLNTSVLRVTDARQQLKIVVRQNNRWDDMRTTTEPTFIRASEIVYSPSSLFTFEAGNEARWLDNRDLRYPRQNTESITYHEPYYHQTLRRDSRPRGYTYYEDFNGGRHIEAYDIHDDAEIAADYTLTHFCLPSTTDDADVYIFGQITDYQLNQRSQMSYDATTREYTATLWMKQGLHNYQYITIPKKTKPTYQFYENNFTDTENDYYILIYYRNYSDTYDRLVGFVRHNTLSTPNSFIN